jgi:hypothetical protein
MHPDEMIPTPWQTLARFARRAAVGAAVAAGVWGAWYGYAAYRLQAKFAEYRARGEPAGREDLELAEEGIDSQKLAVAAANISDDDFNFIGGNADSLLETPLPLPQEMISQMRRVVERSARVRGLMKEAQEAQSAWWADSARPQLKPVSLGVSHRVASYWKGIARYSHQIGQGQATIEALDDMRTCADALARGPWLVGQLASAGQYGMIAQTVQDLAPDLRLRSADFPGGILREDAERLIRQLVDLRTQAVHFRRSHMNTRALAAERQANAELILRPLYRLDACRFLKHLDTLIDVLGDGNTPYPVVRATNPALRQGLLTLVDTNFEQIARPLTRFDSTHWVAVEVFDKYLVEQRMAAVRLAIRLYEIDHQGAIPPTLQDLVPNYLKSVPADPFREDGGNLQYDVKRRILYSVGMDSRDDGGKQLPLPLGRVNWQYDGVIGLDRVIVPSSTSVDPQSLDD